MRLLTSINNQMATINRKIRQFSDISLVFGIHPATADVVKKNDEEAVKASIRNLILTKNYERPFHPEIGCQVHSLLFELWDPVLKNVVEKSVQDVIDKFEPRAKLVTVEVTDKSDTNEIDVTVTFMMQNINSPVTVTTTLSRAR